MMFQISYGIGNGYNVHETELIDATDLNEANQIAYECSLNLFEYYGVFDNQVPEEELEGLNDEEIQGLYMEEVERWIEYDAEQVEV